STAPASALSLHDALPISPGLHVSPGAFALVAMAAVFGASARATFASMVFVFEVTRDYQIILPLMLASVVADIVASALMRESLMRSEEHTSELQSRFDLVC